MSKLLNEAINYAAACHGEQKRKMNGTPYILHPMEVAAIVATLTSDESAIMAGLLHDVIEDTGVSPEELAQRFGEDTAMLVMSETEDKRRDLPAESTWKIRKEESLAFLKNAQDERIKILWLSDKLSNMRSLYRGVREEGDKVFERFHEKRKSEHEWYYRTIAEYTSEYKNTAAYEEYTELLDKVF